MTDVVEKCARALCAHDVRAEPGDDSDYAHRAAAHVDECWRNYIPDALAVIDALADGVSDEMARAAEMMLCECEEVGGIDDSTAMRRAIRAAIRAAKSREG